MHEIVIVEGLINATSGAPAPVPHRPSALMPIRSIKTQRESCGKRRRSYGRWTLSEMVRDIRPRTTGAATRPQCEKKSFRSEYAFAKKEGRSSAPRSHRRAVPFLLSPSLSLAHSLIPPMFHPSSTLFHGVKWRITHLGNVLSIDRNGGDE